MTLRAEMSERRRAEFRMKDITLSQWQSESDEENSREEQWYTKPPVVNTLIFSLYFDW